MANRRIRKKRELWRRPLREVRVSARWAQAHLERIVQRIRRYPHEAYLVEVEPGREVAMVSSRWHDSVKEASRLLGRSPSLSSNRSQ